MKKNMGKLDSIIRISLAVLVAILYLAGIINGVIASVLGVLALIFLITGFINFCPLYYPFKISTRKK